MALFIVDTNVMSAIMRGDQEAEQRLLQQPRNAVYLAQPVIAEISFGLARLPRSRRKTDLVRRFDLLASVLPRAEWTDETSQSFGSTKADLEQRGQRLDDFDIAIAAHALALGAAVATRNVQHFSRIRGLEVATW